MEKIERMTQSTDISLQDFSSQFTRMDVQLKKTRRKNEKLSMNSNTNHNNQLPTADSPSAIRQII